jgi:ADP-ribosylglycohydrolase
MVHPSEKKKKTNLRAFIVDTMKEQYPDMTFTDDAIQLLLLAAAAAQHQQQPKGQRA